MTDPSQELELLDTLLTSGGWDLIQAKFQKEWGRSGERYCDLLEKLANTTEPGKAAEDMQRVIWVRKELEAFFKSLVERHSQLKVGRHPQEPNPSRRGVL
jgi:hypothetical protein